MNDTDPAVPTVSRRCIVAAPLSLAIATSASRLHAQSPLPDLALQPTRVITELGPDHVKSSRGSQGVPALERAANGRLWAAWYAGKSPRGVEGPFSYVVLATSGDDGKTWVEKLVLQPRRFVHTYDPCLWIDPRGQLWFFWAQSAGLQDGRMGVWAMITDEQESENPSWSEPRRIANGIMLNKPTVLKNGTWLFPIGLWRDNTGLPNIRLDNYDLSPYTKEMLEHDLGDERGSNVYWSIDDGETFERIGQVRAPGTRVDEHMLVERDDGALWMLIRTTKGDRSKCFLGRGPSLGASDSLPGRTPSGEQTLLHQAIAIWCASDGAQQRAGRQTFAHDRLCVRR